MKPTPPIQVNFAQAEYDKKKKRTRREIFLAKMEQVVPWARLVEVIAPHYPKSGKCGWPPIGLERMGGCAGFGVNGFSFKPATSVLQTGS